MNAGEDTKKSGKKVLIGTLAALVVLVLAFLFITGRFPPKGGAAGAGTSEKSYVAVQENEKALEDCVRAALDEDTVKAVSEITVQERNGEYSARVRLVVAGGFYFPEVIEQTAQPFFDKAEELGLTVEKYTVEEYSKGNTGDLENYINWQTKDGVTGTYADDTGKEPYIKTKATADDIRDIVK